MAKLTIVIAFFMVVSLIQAIPIQKRDLEHSKGLLSLEGYPPEIGLESSLAKLDDVSRAKRQFTFGLDININPPQRRKPKPEPEDDEEYE